MLMSRPDRMTVPPALGIPASIDVPFADTVAPMDSCVEAVNDTEPPCAEPLADTLPPWISMDWAAIATDPPVPWVVGAAAGAAASALICPEFRASMLTAIAMLPPWVAPSATTFPSI